MSSGSGSRQSSNNHRKHVRWHCDWLQRRDTWYPKKLQPRLEGGVGFQAGEAKTWVGREWEGKYRLERCSECKTDRLGLNSYHVPGTVFSILDTSCRWTSQHLIEVGIAPWVLVASLKIKEQHSLEPHSLKSEMTGLLGIESKV